MEQQKQKEIRTERIIRGLLVLAFIVPFAVIGIAVGTVMATNAGANNNNPTPPPLTPLAAPIISLSEANLTWNAVPFALGYHLFVELNVLQSLPSSQTTLDLAELDLPEGNHQIHIQAIGDHVNFASSGLSNPVTFTIKTEEGNGGEEPPPSMTQLEQPDGLRLEGAILIWNTVHGAAAYHIYVDGVASGRQTASDRFDLRVLHLSPGNHQIAIRAIAGPDVAHSELSQSITFIV